MRKGSIKIVHAVFRYGVIRVLALGNTGKSEKTKPKQHLSFLSLTLLTSPKDSDHHSYLQMEVKASAPFQGIQEACPVWTVTCG